MSNLITCPSCGGAAEITDRWVREYEEEHTTMVGDELLVAWLPGFMEFVSTRCVRGHFFSGPVFAVMEKRPPIEESKPQQQGGNGVQEEKTA